MEDLTRDEALNFFRLAIRNYRRCQDALTVCVIAARFMSKFLRDEVTDERIRGLVTRLMEGIHSATCIQAIIV